MQIHRQQFLQYCIGSAATLGLPASVLAKLETSLCADRQSQPKVIWLNGVNSSNCTLSLANLFNQTDPTDIANLLLNSIDLPCHCNLMVEAGGQAIQQLLETAQGSYLLVIDGDVQKDLNGQTCMLRTGQGEEMSAMEALQILAPGASTVLAIGTCTSFGSMPPPADPNPTGIISVSEMTGMPTINMPGCPTHPDWIVWTIAHLLSGETLQTDSYNRPIELYGTSVQEHCLRRSHHKARDYVWPDSPNGSLQFSKVRWNTKKAQLKVQGKGTAGHSVSIYNPDNGALLGTVAVDDSGKWRLRHCNPLPSPLRLLAKSDNQTIFSKVPKSTVTAN